MDKHEFLISGLLIILCVIIAAFATLHVNEVGHSFSAVKNLIFLTHNG